MVRTGLTRVRVLNPYELVTPNGIEAFIATDLLINFITK